MPSERVQRQIDRFLDAAEEAVSEKNWTLAREHAEAVLDLDPENEVARSFLAAAARALTRGSAPDGADSISQPDAPAVTPSAPEPASFCDGRYQVKRFLGEGGKKRVYLAADTLLDRDVAFALIKTDGLDDVGRERVRREAQAMGRLGAHPHVVSVFDLGDVPSARPASPAHPELVEGSQPFIVTELMGGGDVEGLIETAAQHRVPLADAIRIADEVCQGLEFAHSKDVVHRDLKPGNVWLTADGTAKLGDFGLAVSLDRTRLTQAGMMVGTVSYMPPEQATGGEVNPRSDLYSLGAMLYELVTGRPPFVGDESVAIITQHLNVPPVSPTWHVPGLPPGLEVLILRLLEKDPAKRPESAAQVREMLASVALASPHPRPLPEGEGADRPAAISEGAGYPAAAGERAGYPALVGGGAGVSRLEGGGPVASPRGRGRPAGAGEGGLPSPLYRRAFVGREAELRQLQAAFDAALSGQGSLAAVVGEPGIGKTALCEQIATFAAIRGGSTLVGHCYEEGSLSLPYLPFIEALRSYVLARDPEGLKQDLGTGAAEVARIVSEVRDRVDVEVKPPSADPDEDRWRLYQAISGFLRNASMVQPLLIILEDLHWADRGTLDLLVFLSRQLVGARLLIVGNYRDVEVDRAHPLSGALAELRRGSTFLRVPLRGLTADEVPRMLAAIAGQDVSWSLAEAVHRQTEGNPLFVQEVLRYLAEEGLVQREDGHWQRTTALEEHIPEGLRDVIGKRLSRLSEAANQVLTTASVIGREFRLDVLQRVANLGEEELIAALEEATARAVVEQRTAVGTVGFRFSHAFFRQTLYEEIFIPRRIRLHQQVGRALEEVYGRRLEEHAAELAEHYAQSTEPGDLAKALKYSELAAQRAMQVFAYAEAARHLEQALRTQEVLDPDDKLKRCDLLLWLCDAMLPLEDPGRIARTVAEIAFDIAETGGESARAARAALLACEAIIRASPGATTQARLPVWSDRAQRHTLEGSVERVYADLYHGRAQIGMGGPAAGHVFLRRAVGRALELGDRAVLFAAAAWGLTRLNALRDRELLERLAVEVRDCSPEGIRAADLGTSLHATGTVLLRCGDRDGAERLWDSLAELAQRTRDSTFEVQALQYPVELAFLDGRLVESASLWSAMASRAQDLGIHPPQSAAQTLFYLGRDLTAELDRPIFQVAIRPNQAARSLVLSYLGRHDEARSIRQTFREIGSDEDESATNIIEYLFEGAILGADLETVSALARRLAPLAGRLTALGFGLNCSVARLLGDAARLLGERGQARDFYEQALDVSARVRFRPEIAITRLHLAELLIGGAIEERTGALSHLDFAIEEFRAMKMQPALERALRHKGLLHA